MSEIAEIREDLIEQLRDDKDWRVRRRAALRLPKFHGEDTYDSLIHALNDRDPDVRHASIVSLGRLGDTRALDWLCRPMFLEDPSVEIRWATVKALGRLGSLANANALARTLDDSEWVVRNQTLLVISDFIRNIPDTIDGEQIKSLIRLLTLSDTEVRGLIVDALARRSTRGLDEMVEALHGQSTVVRAGVAEALGLSKDPRAIAPLVEATRDKMSAVRTEAARGLGRLGASWAVEALIEVLGDSNALTCRAAIEALVALGNPAVEPLCNALRHTIPKLHRRNVILTLGGIGDERAVIPLLNNLGSTYFVVRQAAITALSAYGETVVDHLLPMVQTVEIPIEPLLQEIYEQKNKRLRLRAIRALGELKKAEAIKFLMEVMKESDRDVMEATQEALSKIGRAAWARHGAVIALGNIGSPKAVPALIRALKDPSVYVRLEAARALATIGDIVAVSPLIEVLLDDEVRHVRQHAAAALRAFGGQSPSVADAFRRALRDDAWEVRVVAARALGRIDDEANVEPLISALEDGSYSVRMSAVLALANLETLALPSLYREVSGPDSPRRGPAVKALWEIVPEELESEVDSLLECPEGERAETVDRIRKALGRRSEG